MLTITVPDTEVFDDEQSRYVVIKGATLNLEHSLLSLSKWEEKWHIHFIDNKEVTTEQLFDYIKCMTINKVDDTVYYLLTPDNIEAIKAYLADSHTATFFSDRKTGGQGLKGQNGKVITSELIYYWMTACNLPFEVCQKWNINRLLTLIRICSEENNPNKKDIPKNEILRTNAELNALRRKQFNSKG